MSSETGSSGQVAVIGRSDTVAAFRAAGLSVFSVRPGPEAADQVEKLVAGGYRVIFFTEDMFGSLEPVLEKYRKAAVPCIVALPTGGARQSVARLKEVVKRAVGADVFGQAPK